jgi:dihydrofolate reductase
MRKIIVAEFIGLDGVVEAPDKWHFPYVDQEMLQAMWSSAGEADTMLLGRVTYESFAGAFADGPADDPVVAQMNRPAKVVVTRSLKELSWRNSTILEGDVVTGVTALKQRTGGSILVVGSTMLARTLLRAGLVDEVDLLLHPIAVGAGERFFDEGPALPMKLAACQPLGNGVIHLRYQLS